MMFRRPGSIGSNDPLQSLLQGKSKIVVSILCNICIPPGSMKFYEHFHCYLRVYLLHCIAHINESANDHHILALWNTNTGHLRAECQVAPG